MIRFKNDDGQSMCTEIVDAQTGQDLTKIISVEYGARITLESGLIKAECRLAMIAIDVVAGKTIFETLNPLTGNYEPVAAIEFRDGTRVEIAEDGTPKASAMDAIGGRRDILAAGGGAL